MKRVLMMEFLASGTRRNPVMKNISGFDFPEPEKYFQQDPAFQYLKDKGCEVVPFFVAKVRGRMYFETFMQITVRLEDALEAALKGGPIDGIWFYTYALSYVDFIGNGEEFLIKIIRNRIGYEVPISIAMDFHGLVTPNVAKMVNIISTFRTNPHTDVEGTRLRAACLLYEAMYRGNPQISYIRIPMLGTDSTRMDVGAGAAVVRYLEALEEIPGVVSAALVTGIVFNNAPDGATCLLACAYPETDRGLLHSRMEMTAKYIWDIRKDWCPIDKIIDIDEAFGYADVIAGNGEKGVVFLNDSGDNPTGSGVGDSAYMLNAAIESKIKGILVAGIWASDFLELCADTYEKEKPESVRDGNITCLKGELWVEGEIGAQVRKEGTRIPIKARLTALRSGNNGEVTGARLECQNVVFLVTKYQEGVLNRTFIDSFGTDLEDYRIVVLKLGYLVPDFLPYKKDCYMVRTPGVTDLDFERIEGEMDAVPRPMFPFDDMEIFEVKFM